MACRRIDFAGERSFAAQVEGDWMVGEVAVAKLAVALSHAVWNTSMWCATHSEMRALNEVVRKPKKTLRKAVGSIFII